MSSELSNDTQISDEAIEELIGSKDSPVGIDALRTHVIIIRKLTQIEQRLARLEATAGGSSTGDESSS